MNPSPTQDALCDVTRPGRRLSVKRFISKYPPQSLGLGNNSIENKKSLTFGISWYYRKSSFNITEFLKSYILGILQRDQENSVVYGSIDTGKTVASNQDFLKLVGLLFFVCLFVFIN